MATYTAQLYDDNFATNGYVRVTWTNAEKGAEFYAWRVYRSIADDLSGWGPWEMLSQTTLDAPTYEFFDYTVPANRQSRYSVVQASQNAQGVVTEDSKNNIRYTTPADDQYWLIHPFDSSLTMALPLATSESFSYEREEESMNLIGKGRKVDQGALLGVIGSLTIDFRVRAEYKRFMKLWTNGSWIFKRNPFGDVDKVVIKKPTMDRVPGVGTREMLIVTLPYEGVFE